MAGAASENLEASIESAVLRSRSLLAQLRHVLEELPSGAEARRKLEPVMARAEEAMGHHPIPAPGDVAASPPQIDPQDTDFPVNRSVAEVLPFLAFTRKTGTCRIRLPDETVSLDLRNGFLIDGQSNNSPPGCRLGEILVARGALSRRSLEAYLAENQGSRKRIGRGLRSKRLINRKKICMALRHQIVHAVWRCLQQPVVSLDFLPRESPYGSVDLHLDLTLLLLEVSTLADEPSFARG